jgi:hypothetical protein
MWYCGKCGPKIEKYVLFLLSLNVYLNDLLGVNLDEELKKHTIFMIVSTRELENVKVAKGGPRWTQVDPLPISLNK